MRKIFNIFLVVLVFGLFSNIALASGSDLQELQEDVNEANAKIQSLIDEAIEEADEIMAEYLEEGEDEEEYMEDIEEIINDLIEETNDIAAEMIREAEERGFQVICEWVSVTIGGQEVMIDPLTIVGS